MLLSVGDKIKPGIYKIYSRFKKVANFVACDQMIAIVDSSVGAGPINLVVKKIPEIWPSELKITAKLINSNRVYNSELDLDLALINKIDFNRLKSHLNLLRMILKEDSHPLSIIFILEKKLINFKSDFEQNFAKQILIGLAAIFNGNFVFGVEKIKGCGFGLTPSGDDFIVGFLLGLYFWQKLRGIDLTVIRSEIYFAALRNNVFTDVFLRLAKDGALAIRIKKFLMALLISNREVVVSRTREIIKNMGATSGSDLLVGILVALRVYEP